MKTIRLAKRTMIRIISFTLAIITTLSIWGISQTVKVSRYAKEMTIAHQRTIASLASYIDTLENDLRKMQYANTATMTSGLSLSLSKASQGAKNCLSELDSGTAQLGNINKFLTQAADIVQSITKKTVAGEPLSAKDRENIEKLYGYATELSKQVGYIEQVMLSGEVDFRNAVSTLGNLTDKGDLSISYSDSVSDAEKSFQDYPTLIYDGPFADNILNKDSEYLKNQETVSENEAKKRASVFTGIEEAKLVKAEDEKSKTEAYVYYNDNTSVAVTKHGGHLLYLITDKFAGETKIKESEAVKKAKAYLEKYGYATVKESYYYTSDGICTINFAHTQDGAICYADLIKVSVSLDKGEITAVDCTGYLMNHQKRTIPEKTIGSSAAKEKISKTLTVKDSKTAFIPMSDGKEIFAYEFLCTDKKQNDVLIYIDAVTGNEADIKLLLYSDGGTLTR